MDELRVSGAFLRWYCGSFRILNWVQWPTDFGAAPSSLASYRVRHHLRRRAPLLLARGSLLLPPSGHYRQAISPRPLARKWPSRLGPPLDKPSCPLDALGPSGARAALPRRRRPSSGWVPPSPPAIPCSLWLKEDEGRRATIREKGGT